VPLPEPPASLPPRAANKKRKKHSGGFAAGVAGQPALIGQARLGLGAKDGGK